MEKKAENIRKMFGQVSGKYDLMNDLLSFGIHRQWKKNTVCAAALMHGDFALDCASGTGDIAILLKKAVGESGKVIASDFTAEMLNIAKMKFGENGTDIEIALADVMDLQFEDNSFDAATIGFGIRNVESPVRCLEEMARVVKPGGRVVILEFGQPGGFFGILYRLYSRYVIPFLGNMVAGTGFAYDYLQESSSQFPAGDDFIKIMEETGRFGEIKMKILFIGIAYIYMGVVF